MRNMNLYKFHADPKSLLHHDIAHEKVPAVFWDKYEDNPDELKKREATIAKDPYYAYLYARHVLKKPFPLGEAAIAKDTYCAYQYAHEVLKKGFYLNGKGLIEFLEYEEMARVS